ncbi:MAG: EF-hand domain-containing protein [Sedimentisphaerales bacterium]|nr:EF-hand domain-containing protein [Sedimentisphaerales bacterium]
MQIEGMSQMMSLMGIGSIGPPSAEKMSEKIFDMKDTDSNGAISVEEFGKSEEKFNAIDANSDGLISQDELFNHINENLQSRMNQPMMLGDFKPDPSKIYKEILSQKDEDGDGALSNSELNISEEMFAAIDTNQDGVINSEEFEAHITEKIGSMESGLEQIGENSDKSQMPPRIAGKKDESEDEEQSSSETDSLSESFSEIDTNKDGYISYAELAAWFGEKSEDPKDLFNQMA